MLSECYSFNLEFVDSVSGVPSVRTAPVVLDVFLMNSKAARSLFFHPSSIYASANATRLHEPRDKIHFEQSPRLLILHLSTSDFQPNFIAAASITLYKLVQIIFLQAPQTGSAGRSQSAASFSFLPLVPQRWHNHRFRLFVRCVARLP